MLLSFAGLSADFNFQTGEWKAPSEADNLKNPLVYNETNIKAGKKTFENLCWSCHGMSGNGSGPASEALVIKPANLANADIQKQSDGAIYWKLSSGRGVMASYSQVLSTTQRWQLVNYIRQFKVTQQTDNIN